ncbi:hypothetical protein [Streptomyces harbinensis]|uniref:Uncharacterized protein n=1 Tax=Streptomyces harbinensis TaxID=1176198 RepID=A0A1I6WDB5_9ACTN|nr:hypothetical protein [Streptomyces harbinensis]SFT23968.1 hypothetical protein SAMN05444716_1222 [Streptomyces harbinensis]
MPNLPDLHTILRWPLYSVRRIIGLSIVLLLAVAAVNMLGARDAERAARAAVDSPSPTPPPSTEDDRGGEEADDGQEQQPDDGQDLDAAMDTAAAFVRAWAAEDVNYVQWMEGMEPYITNQFREAIQTGHPDNISVTTVERVQITQTGTAGRTSAAITTDAGMLSVTLVSYTAGQTWLVSGISPGAQPEPGT